MNTLSLETPSVDIDLDSTRTTVSYSYLVNDPDKISTVKSIDLYYQGNKLDIKAINNQYSNLYTDSEYELVITLLNDYQDGRLPKEEEYRKTIKTEAYSIPSLTLELTSTAETINYKVNLADPHSLIRVNKINVYYRDELVKEVTDINKLVIEELQSNTLYTVEVEYEYNLNDNHGYIKQTYRKDYSTLAHNVVVIGYELINNLNPKTNEDINIKVNLENKSKVKMDYIVVNGIKKQIAGGDYFNNIIFIDTAPKSSGEYTIKIEKIGYFLNGVEVEQAVESEIEIVINIMSRLDIISVSTFDGSSVYKINDGLGFVFEIDNPFGYEILEYEFADGLKYPVSMIDNNHVYIVPEVENMTWFRNIKSVTYIDENGSIAVRKYEEELEINIAFLYGESETNALVVHSISTPEEFMNMERDKAYELISDIDMSGYVWKPYDFDGYFDGKGHKISNLSLIEDNEYTYLEFGIFTSMVGVFKNVYFENLYMNIKTKERVTTSILYINAYDLTLDNVFFSGNINITYQENATNDISVPSGNNIYAVEGLKLNQRDYPGLDVVSKETYESEEFRTNILNWNFKEKELGNYNGLLYTIINNSYIVINGYEGTDYELIIPETINKLPVVGILDLAFANNKTIKSLTYPDTLFVIGASTLSGCSNLETLVIEDVSIIKGYLIKMLFGGLSYDDSYLVYYDGTSVYVPNNFKNLTIGNKSDVYFSFRDLVSLRRVEMLDGMKFVPGSAFLGCTKLESVIIPSSVTTIESYAFDSCRELSYLTFGDNSSLTEIKYSAFMNCTSLSEINLPSGVETIGDQAFYGALLQKVSLSPALKEIGNNAFTDSDIKEIVIPSTVTKIGSSAFYGCIYLKTVIFEENSQLVELGESAFYNTGITEIHLPDGVKRIEANTFNACYNLQSITFSDTLEYIGDCAFAQHYDSSKPIYIWIPNTVRKVEESAFSGVWYIYCEAGEKPAGWHDNWHSNGNIAAIYWNVSNIYENDTFKYFISDGEATIIKYLKDETNVIIPDNIVIDNNTYPIKHIGDSVFAGKILETISLPKSLVSIGVASFQSCKNLVSIDIPETVTTIGYSAFESCINLTSIALPDNITVLNDNVFTSCGKLQSIKLPENLVEIGAYAFSGCGKLQSLDIPNSVRKIGSNAFYGCDEIKYFFIPEGVTRIEDSTFANCNKAIEIILPSTLTYIGDYVFSGSGISLKNIFIPYSVEYVGFLAFGYTNTTIYCGAESLPSSWFADWNQYGNEVHWDCKGKIIQDDIVYIFENDNELSVHNYIGNGGDILIPDEIEFEGTLYPVTKIDGAFVGNDNITSLKLSNNILVIEAYVLSGMSKLKKVTLPNKLQTIKERAFYGCQSLEEINIPSTVTTIEGYVFDACPSLKEIYIPKSVVVMGDYVFDDYSRQIYCEAASQPSTWSYCWNNMKNNVTWNYVKK